MSFFGKYPPGGGGSGGVPTYATLAAFPPASVAGNGALAIALDTNILYESNGTTWLELANPADVGTVTSVALAAPSIFTVSGSPVTTSGTLTLSYSGTPLPVLNGGTGVTTSTGTGSVVLNSSPSLITPALGTPSALVLTNATGLPVAGGGTGTASFALDGVLFGNGTSAIGVTAAGTTGQVLTATTGSAPTWAAPATAGTVTSVAATVPAFLSISGSPITSSGTLGITLSGTALPVLNGGTGVTTSTGTGSTVLSNSPTLVTPALGTPSALVLTNATGLPVAGGGTGAATFTTDGILYGNGTAAIGVTAAGTTGQVLTAVTSGAPIWSAAGTGTVTSVSSTGATGLTLTTASPTTTPSITLGGTLTVAGGGTGVGTLASHGVVYGNGTSNVGVTAAGTTGQILTATTGSAPTWAAPAAIPSAIRVYYTNQQTWTLGSLIAVEFDTVQYDRLSEYNTSTGRFTATNAGLYLFAFCLRVTGPSNFSDTFAILQLNDQTSLVNESTFRWGTVANGGVYPVGGSTVVSLAAGNTLRLVLQIDGTGAGQAVDFGSIATSNMSITYLGS